MIFLHGRGSTGEEFAEDLLASEMDGGESLPSSLPGWRWVFPSSRELWSTAFQERIPAWFEAHSLTDITARQDLQEEGIRESVRYIRAIVHEEIERLHGDAGKVFLGGISQGGAVGLWTLLVEPNFLRKVDGLGGFVGASTWLPFAKNIERVLFPEKRPGENVPTLVEQESDSFVREMMAPAWTRASDVPRSIPFILCHGQDDAYVDLELGKQAAQVMEQYGVAVQFNSYIGAEEEGHWFKVPEGVQDIYDFLSTKSHAKSENSEHGSKADKIR